MTEIPLDFMVDVNEVIVLSLPWRAPHPGDRRGRRAEASNQSRSAPVRALSSPGFCEFSGVPLVFVSSAHRLNAGTLLFWTTFLLTSLMLHEVSDSAAYHVAAMSLGD